MTISAKFVKITAACVGAAAVAAGIVGISVTVSRANSSALTDNAADDSAAFFDVAIPEGRYYFNGDTASEYWIDVSDDIINLCGPDIEGELYETMKEDGISETEEVVREAAHNSVEQYLQPNEYRAVKLNGMDDIAVFIEWGEDDGCISGYGYTYTEDNTLNWSGMGDFILAE